MALNQITENLDQISEHELGIKIDEAAIWTKLVQRLDYRKRYPYWWVVAACILLGLAFFPISMLRETPTPMSAIISQVELPVNGPPMAIGIENTFEPTPPKKEEFVLESKGVEPIQLAQVQVSSLNLQPIVVDKIEKQKPAFAAEDISVIQASLERPSIEKGRTITIRAQWKASPENLNVNYQALKIKLHEKHE